MSEREGEKPCRLGLNVWGVFESPLKLGPDCGVKMFCGVGTLLDWGVEEAARFCGTFL